MSDTPRPVRDGGLWLEDLAPGMRFVTGTHEMTAEAIVRFAAVFDPQPFHVDVATATESFFGELVASAWHTAAVSMRLLATSGPPIATGIIGASVEFTMPSATRPGDVLHVDLLVEDIVPSTRSDRGSILVSYRTFNQEGDVRQDSRARLIGWRRPAPGAGTAPLTRPTADR